MPREYDRRLPDWVEGTPIEWLDGQTWHLPKPTMEFRLVSGNLVQASPPPGVETNIRFGPRFYALREKLIEHYGGRDPEAEATDEQAVAEFGMIAAGAVDLLRRNYSLTDDEIIELFPVVVHERGFAFFGRLADCVLCSAKKPDAATTG